uniref:Lipoprotein n=1 Tax=viral metagenome TaxID=1070528 RepID=A0A6M3LIX0_9ZZZZ
MNRTIIIFSLFLFLGCAISPVPKENLFFPLKNGGYFILPKELITKELYFTNEEMTNMEKWHKKAKKIIEYYNNKKKAGCPAGEICG